MLPPNVRDPVKVIKGGGVVPAVTWQQMEEEKEFVSSSFTSFLNG